MARSKTILHDKQIVGVVYKYTSPSGKSYIGQTTNERHRRNTWFCIKRRYAGKTIEKARLKYGPENFTYTVLFKQVFSSFEEAEAVLDKLEMYYIGMYDTFRNGYNNTTGGIVPQEGIRPNICGREIEREEAIIQAKRRKYREKHTREEINFLRKQTNRLNGRWQKIFQFSLDGVFIREFASAGEAQEMGFGSNMNIKRACRTLGSYKGYCWRFAEDGYDMKVKPKRDYSKEDHTYACSPIKQYDKSGDFIADYPSIKDALAAIGRAKGSCISACAAGRLPSAYGYVWVYKNE